MFLDDKKKIMADKHTYFCETNNYSVWWEGILFIKKIPSGNDSIEHFLGEVSRIGIARACKCLSGNFSCIIWDKSNGKYYAFVDNGGFSLLFYKDLLVSSSFLSLLDETDITLQNIDPFSVIEFIYSGSIFGRTPFFSDISIVDSEQILIISESGLEIILKELEPISPSPDPEKDFLRTIDEISTSLKNQRIMLHLTGGSDTRLLSVTLKNTGLNFETITLGHAGDDDVEIAGRFAEVMGFKHSFKHSTVGTEENILRELNTIFEQCDGLADIFQYHTYGSHVQKEWYKDIDLQISGVGGELYKFAGWWTLKKQNHETTIERLVHLGLVNWYSGPQIPLNFFTDDFKKHALNYKSHILTDLNARFTNAEGKTLADKIFYQYSVRGIFRSSASGQHINIYAPLLDQELVACANAIPSYKRYYSGFHRKLITISNPKVAKLKTNDPQYGYLRAAKSLLLGYFERPIRITNRILRLLTKPEDPDSSNSDRNIYEVVKLSKNANENLDYLKACKIVRPDMSVADIDDKSFGRLFSLAELLKRLKG